MAVKNDSVTVEGPGGLPVVRASGLNTNKNVDFDSGSNTCALPASTTVGGSPISAMGNITGSNTTGATFSVTNSGVYTGVGSFQNIADSATTGVGALMTANGLTTGSVLSLTSTGTIVTTGEVLNVAANSATTSSGLVRVSGTGLTSGYAMEITSGGANLTTGGALNISNGASTAGVAVVVTSTGVMTTTAGLLTLTGNSATTASGLLRVSGTGLTSGIGIQVTAATATLTTGRYISFNDGTGEVLGVGANGHIHTLLAGATAPVMTTNSTGISATAIIAGSTDVAGGFTTTGTPQSGTVLTCTFNKTYTSAPKFVVISPLNAAAGNPNTVPYVSSITATTFVLTWPAGGTYAATPSYAYLVVA